MRKVNLLPLVLLVGLLHPLPVLATGDFLTTGIAEYRAENYEEALESFALARQSGEDETLAYYLGLTRKRMGDARGALGSFREALRLGAPPAAVYRELADCYLVLDDPAGARQALADGEAAGVRASELNLVRGQLLARERRYDEALATFSQVEKEAPELAGQARFQMAQIYAAQQKPQQARASLQAVIDMSPDSELAAYARDYERQFAAAIEQHRTWRATTQFAYLYDSNAIGKPEDDVNLTDAVDHAWVANLRLDYQPLLEGNILFSGRYAVNTATYDENDSSNQIVQNLTLTPGVKGAAGSLTVPVYYTHYFLDGEQYQQLIGTRPTLNLRMGRAQIVQLSGGYAHRTMLRDYLNAATEALESRDADVFTAGGGYIYLFAGGRGMSNLRYEWSDDQARGSNWRIKGDKLALNLLLPLSASVAANGGGEVLWQNFEGEHSFYGYRREDRVYGATAGLSWEVLAALKLYTQYSFTRADSNLPVYDYSRHAVTAGVEINF